MDGKILVYILAGGAGSRLYPLTRDRAKPGVPFGGSYRIIDFALSNAYNSDLRKILVLTQFRSRSLHRHLKFGWYPKFGIGGHEYITTLPAHQGETKGWFQGTADAVFKNMEFVSDEEPDMVDILGADHIYMFDVRQMNSFHSDREADLTISAIPVAKELAAGNYGVLEVNDNWELVDFREKPADPAAIPGQKDFCLASMGNYVFNPKVLEEELRLDANKKSATENEDILAEPERYSKHDFGFDIIPSLLRRKGRIYVYNFAENKVPGASPDEKSFWRDVGTLDQYYEASMEARSRSPQINLYNRSWPIGTYPESHQPSKFVGDPCSGFAGLVDSLTANGVVVIQALVKNSVLSYNVMVEEGAVIEDSILLGNNTVGSEAKLRKVIMDRGVEVPERETIGFDMEKDRSRGLKVTESGITVVPRKYAFH